MAPKSKRDKSVLSRKRTNPIGTYRGYLPRIPRPRISFNGHLLKGTATISAAITSSGEAFDYHFVDCNVTWGISRAHTAISDSYQKYVYKSLVMEWLPAVGPADTGARTQYAMTYLDNAEMMFFIQNSATSATARSLILASNCKMWNAWERVTFRIPLTRRRKSFPVNTNYTPSELEMERSTQGLVCMSAFNAPSNAVYGSYRFYYEIELSELASNPGT
jgi:hypothetical protein